MPLPKPVTVTFTPVKLKELVATGNLLFPELEASKLHMDGSMVIFLKALLEQYALEKLTLLPANKSPEALMEYMEHDLILNTQAELLNYILHLDEHNKVQSELQNPTT